MPRQLAITWSARTLRYVHTDSDRQGRLRLLDAGKEIADADVAEVSIDERIQKLVKKLKADKSRVLILVNRGSVDSATFNVPPAAESELPALVQNLAIHNIAGASDQSPIDFIAYPANADGTRPVSAMTLLAEEQLLAKRLAEQSGFRLHQVLVSTHPLRSFLPELLRIEQQNSDAPSTTLVVSRGDDVADLLLCSNGIPLLSRTIRLPEEFPAADINRYLQAETQRTLLSASSQIVPATRVTHVVIVGDEEQTRGLDQALGEQFDAVGVALRPTSLLAEVDSDELSLIVNSGSFASLIAAVWEDSHQVKPAVDFANPRRPPAKRNRFGLLMTASVAVAMLAAGGTWYVWSQFGEIDQENARLVDQLNELNSLVKETESRRLMVRLVDGWEKNRISWPDELRDLTERIPSSPELVVQQLTISPAGSGTAVATFRGVGKQAETITQMESRLRDKYHDIRIPGVREQQEGNKVTATFQATLTIRKRTASQYKPTDAKEQQSNASSK